MAFASPQELKVRIIKTAATASNLVITAVLPYSFLDPLKRLFQAIYFSCSMIGIMRWLLNKQKRPHKYGQQAMVRARCTKLRLSCEECVAHRSWE